MRAWWKRRLVNAEVADPAPTVTLANHYRNECERIAAQVHATPDRGFDSKRARAELFVQWNRAYELYLRCKTLER